METGIKAWIANVDGDAHIDLPGGWHWDVSRKQTGFLSAPGGRLCVGYDLKNETIQFGDKGQTEAPGLNLWTVQEMGEKFAYEHFMDEETRKEYDQFAEVRGTKRKEYEKGVRNMMTGLIQMELKDGQWIAHVDTEGVKAMVGIDSKPEITREEGVALFNTMSKMRHVMPLRDPLGYMTLNNNLYNYIKEQYEIQYDEMIGNIENGLINGNGRGCEAILDKLDSVVRKNLREYCLPDGINYQDLRNIAVTDGLEDAVGEFVKQRVTKTVNFEKKRDHTKESLERDHERFLKAADALKDEIASVAFPSMDVSITENNDIKIE